MQQSLMDFHRKHKPIEWFYYGRMLRKSDCKVCNDKWEKDAYEDCLKKVGDSLVPYRSS